MVKGKTGARGIGKRIQHREIFDISNLDDDGRILDADDQRATYQQGNQLWHTDSSFRQKSATWSLLHARVIPPDGADTEFIDTRAVYDALSDAMKSRIEGLVAEHSIWHSRAKLGGYVPSEEERHSRPPAQHPLVRRHPSSGRKALYIASHASHIVGWPIEQGRALLEELIDFATQGEIRLCASVARRRSGDLGQPVHASSRHAVPIKPVRARSTPHHDHRRGASCRGLTAIRKCKKRTQPVAEASRPHPFFSRDCAVMSRAISKKRPLALLLCHLLVGLLVLGGLGGLRRSTTRTRAHILDIPFIGRIGLLGWCGGGLLLGSLSRSNRERRPRWPQ